MGRNNTKNKDDQTSIFMSTELGSPINKVALPLLSKRFNGFCPGGTAIMITRYLAITARHVVNAYFKDSEKISIPLANNEQSIVANHLIQAAQILENGKIGALWNINKWWPSNHTDIAFLFLTPGNQAALEYKGHTLSMDLIPPKVGDTVYGFGYHSAEIVSNKRELLWRTAPTTISGKIQEIHQISRDKSFLNFPCFRINAQTKNDMSGGPVFNEHGDLCGLICSSFEDEAITYVTMLWPMLGTQIDIDRDKHPKNTKYRVLELAQSNVLRAKGWKNVALQGNADGGIDVCYIS